MKNREIINLIHVLIVGPLLINVGLKKKKTSDAIFNLLVALGVIVILYHGYKIFTMFSLKKINEPFNKKTRPASGPASVEGLED